MNNENKKIFEDVKLKIAISNFEKEEKETMKYNRKNILKVVAVACCILILTTGGVFAKDITNFIKNLFGANTSGGVDTAVNNGYIADVETEYQNADGIEIKIDTILMDDFNFDINFNVKLSDNYSFEDFDGNMEFEDLKVVDENGEIVFITHPYDKNLDYKGAYSFLPQKITDKEFKVSFSATGSTETFPRSKHLTIEFTKIIKSEFVNSKMTSKTYEGNWKFEIDVAEEFYNRKSTIYTVKKCNFDNINVTKAILSNTAFKIELITDTNTISYEKPNTEDLIVIGDYIALKDEYVETSNGKKFEPARKSDGDGGYGISKDNIIQYYQTFNLTSYDATDDITVHIFTNNGEEIIIELERNK